MALFKDAVIQLGVVGVTTLIATGLPVVLKIDELDTLVSQKVGFCPTPEKYDALVLGFTVIVPEATALPVQPPAPADINKYRYMYQVVQLLKELFSNFIICWSSYSYRRCKSKT